jgi:tellurite resistance-related uncharacterized protein
MVTRPTTVRFGIMADSATLPPDLDLVRTTAVWDEHTVPDGLLSAHRVADGVWGQLVVRSGAVGFVFEDEPDVTHRLSTDERITIPPGRPHHVALDGPVTFVVEFYR